MAFRTRARWPLTLATMIICVTGCRGDRPDSSPLPTVDQIVANSQAVGIPYDTYVLIRNGDRQIALKITSLSVLGDQISYTWEELEQSSNDQGGPVARRGEGKTTELQHLLTGWIGIPGLDLTWSRGSSDIGWIYWPENHPDFAVFSRPWMRQVDIDPKSRSGKWLRKSRR